MGRYFALAALLTLAGCYNMPGGDVTALPFNQNHGDIDALGFRFGGMAYSPDVIDIPESSVAALQGIELWIVDCMRRAPHPTHSDLGKTLGWIQRLRPRRSILTHMDESLDYRRLRAELPAGIEPGYDGLVIKLPDPVSEFP